MKNLSGGDPQKWDFFGSRLVKAVFFFCVRSVWEKCSRKLETGSFLDPEADLESRASIFCDAHCFGVVKCQARFIRVLFKNSKNSPGDGVAPLGGFLLAPSHSKIPDFSTWACSWELRVKT